MFSFAVNNNSFSGTVDVYSGVTLTGSYTSLDLALAQVGLGLNTGAVTVKINASHAPLASTIGSAGFTSCLIYPTAAVTLTYAGAATCIALNGSDNVTIDGRLNGVENIGNTNSLSIVCSSTGANVRGIQFNNGAVNSTVRNVNVTVPTVTTSITGGRCINIAQSTAVLGGNNNAIVKYCNLSGGDRTLQTFGNTLIQENLNTTFYGNKVRNFSSIGIFLGSVVVGVTCDSNEVYCDQNVWLGGSSDAGGFASTSRGIAIQSMGTINVRNNIIHDITDLSATRVNGLSVQGMICIPVRDAIPAVNPPTNVTIQNNFVRLGQSNLKATTTYGMFVANTAAASALDYNGKVYNNTSIIFGTGSATAQQFTYALIFDIASVGSVQNPSTATYYNNVGMNLRGGTVTSQHVGMDFEVEPGAATVSDFNTCYADGTTGVYFDATDATFGYVTTFSWRDANCPDYEQHSAMHPVNYDANYQPTINYGDLNGKVLAGVPKDLFGATRPGTYPYRGAVEGEALKELTVTANLEGRTGPENSDMIIALIDGSCNFVDYACGYFTDTDNSPKFIYSTAVANGPTTYSLQCLTETAMESWSSGTVMFSGGIASYIFDSPLKVYGSNSTNTGDFYNSDVNQDGTIDASDVSLVDNDVVLGNCHCRLHTDITYDGCVDGSDLSIVDGNATIGVFSVPKCSPNSPILERIRMNQKNLQRVRLSSESKERYKNEMGY